MCDVEAIFHTFWLINYFHPNHKTLALHFEENFPWQQECMYEKNIRTKIY